MPPTLGQMTPTLHLRASHSARQVPPALDLRPPCAKCHLPYTCAYPTPPAQLPYTMCRLPYTPPGARGRWRGTDSEPDHRSPLQKPPQCKGTQLAAPTSKNPTFTYPVPGSGAPPALLTYPPTGFWPTARQDGLPVRL